MNQPSGQLPLYLPRPMIVIGAGVIVLAWMGAFAELEPRESSFAFGSDIKPSIGRIDDVTRELPDWGVALVPRNGFRFFRVQGGLYDPAQCLAFANVSARLIGRVGPLETARDQWQTALEQLESSDDPDRAWVSDDNRAMGTKCYVRKHTVGGSEFLITMHVFGNPPPDFDGESNPFDELLRCFEPL